MSGQYKVYTAGVSRPQLSMHRQFWKAISVSLTQQLSGKKGSFSTFKHNDVTVRDCESKWMAITHTASHFIALSSPLPECVHKNKRHPQKQSVTNYLSTAERGRSYDRTSSSVLARSFKTNECTNLRPISSRHPRFASVVRPAAPGSILFARL